MLQTLHQLANLSNRINFKSKNDLLERKVKKGKEKKKKKRKEKKKKRKRKKKEKKKKKKEKIQALRYDQEH